MLAVARVMIEAVELATGFCTLPIAEIAKRASCSTKSVTKARAALSESGLWIVALAVCSFPVALNSNQVVERKGRKAVGGNTKVPSLYHLSVVSDPSSLGFPASYAFGSEPHRAYQADMLGAPVVDLDADATGAASFLSMWRQRCERRCGRVV